MSGSSTGGRRSEVLSALINEYIQSAAPVSSAQIARSYLSGVSSATIRNDLFALEHDGFVYAPHTSAGRIPTNVGYRVFVNRILLSLNNPQGNLQIHKAMGIQEIPDNLLTSEVSTDSDFTADPIYSTLQTLTHLTGLLSVFWWSVKSAKTRPQIQFTGLSGLLRQPEFAHSDSLAPLLELLEMPNDIASFSESRLSNSDLIVLVGLGSKDPYTSYSLLSRRLHFKHPGVLGIIGPTRMEYQKAINALDAAARQLEYMLIQ
ncbi:MAG: hypothetical protein LBH87_00685 [Coriobacteriales bacterium]|jgi:transcriptional regulator of heat shock response|nr:hypothetical protein [Coriobacteriales bacterium]